MLIRLHKHNKLLLTASLLVLLFGVVIFLNGSKKDATIKNPAVQKSSGEIISGTFDESSFKTEAEWKAILTSEQYHILREAGTEIPFTGALNNEKRQGTYYSIGCDKPLFRSEQKYDSGTGWPSFTAPIDDKALVLRKENTPGDNRIEVLDTCGNHLGHVFDDGPPTLPDGRQATGKRYCMNSVALRFVPDEN